MLITKLTENIETIGHRDLHNMDSARGFSN